ncbi:hypothetical protein AMR41_26995 [Hapalosiphon sp. MRB220]|nr:hypothetical protein AMR41_26995 [Hapalosiphon sp. MRB220]
MNFYLFLENLLFFLVATSFTVVVGWAWRDSKPMTLPEVLPGWYKVWFGTVQILGIVLPLVVMLLWGVVWGYSSVLMVFASYFLMLGLQILSEFLTLRKFHSVVWVMVPYLYLPYRFWQLYEGLTIISSDQELMWVKITLVIEIIVWVGNYMLDVTQLPRLFRWEVQENSEIEINN